MNIEDSREYQALAGYPKTQKLAGIYMNKLKPYVSEDGYINIEELLPKDISPEDMYDIGQASVDIANMQPNFGEGNPDELLSSLEQGLVDFENTGKYIPSPFDNATVLPEGMVSHLNENPEIMSNLMTGNLTIDDMLNTIAKGKGPQQLQFAGLGYNV